MSEQKDRMLSGELYRANDPELRADSERCDSEKKRAPGIAARRTCPPMSMLAASR